MGTFIAIVFIVVILWLYIGHKIKENEEENARKYRQSEENRLRKEYPDGFDYYKYRNDKRIIGLDYSSRMVCRSTDEMVSLKSEIIKNKDKLILQGKRRQKQMIGL